jgi:hypothetical protein
MSYNVYHNPKNVMLGSTAITGVVSVAVSQTYGELHAAADSDVHESLAVRTTGRTTGTLGLLDPVQAQALAGSSGTLSFVWSNAAGGTSTDKTVTITGCAFAGWNGQVSREQASRAVLSFIAAKPDGSNPVGVA